MGLWEFLRQWRPSRVTIGILASILLHLAIVAVVLWGGLLLPHSRRDVKKGDSLIVELPKPEEPAPAGSPSAPAPPSRPSPPSPPSPPAAPKPPAVTAPAPPPKAAPAPKTVPAPSQERQVASTPRAPAPAPTPPAPKAAEPLPPVPKGTEPTPAPPEPSPKATAPAPEPQAAPSGPAAPARPPAEQKVASLPPSGQPSAPPAPDSRTALRRGAGGAGGTGLPGRGGIEGEPIPLDSDNPRFNDYLEQVRRRIQANWVYPCLKSGQNCEYREATLEIEFGILKDGRLQFVELVRKSEYEVYDEYATNAIKLASPFPPVPASMMSTTKAGSAGVPIRARFVYLIVKSSLTNLLH